MTSTAIMWFRDDLRISDNPALTQASQQHDAVIALYILDNKGSRAHGAASRWWLHHNLDALSQSLDEAGNSLVLAEGYAPDVLKELVKKHEVEALYANACFCPSQRETDNVVQSELEALNCTFNVGQGKLLFDPSKNKTLAGAPYKVYTPFWKSCLKKPAPATPLAAPSSVPPIAETVTSKTLTELALRPQKPNWADGWSNEWQPSTAGAKEQFSEFIDEGLKGYGELRNRPDQMAHVSKLSPHLRFGTVSPRQIWHSVKSAITEDPSREKDANKYLSELGWRDFSYYLLTHFPHIRSKNFNDKFDAFPWVENNEHLAAWQRGQTGYPIVDAGMRQLWATGWMHNRVRMVVASFLVKHLLIHWREGEAWFWDTLIDADPANNTASWQWVAGCGADAAPYFRIFNPIIQGKRFDPDGIYTKKWLPELKDMPKEYLFSPWEAPSNILEDANIALGVNYPNPIVKHEDSRKKALAAYEAIKG